MTKERRLGLVIAVLLTLLLYGWAFFGGYLPWKPVEELPKLAGE